MLTDLRIISSTREKEISDREVLHMTGWLNLLKNGIVPDEVYTGLIMACQLIITANLMPL